MFCFFTKPILVKFSTAQVTVGFSVNNEIQCVNNNLFIFTNTTTSTAEASYLWTFDDGSTSSDLNPTKIFSQARTYNVTLMATVSGINYYHSKQITVEPKPQVSFNVIKGTYNGASFTFISTSTITSGNMNYLWDFGDGTTSTLINPTKTYLQTGVNQVKLTVTSTNGCNDSVTKSVYPILCTLGNWLGAENNKWSNPNNWCLNTLPSNTDTVRLLKGIVNMPILDSASFTTAWLQIDSSTTLQIKNNATLQINGCIMNDGNLVADSGNIILSAANNSIIKSVNNYTIQNLTLQNNNNTTLLGNGLCNISGVLKFGNGTNYDTLFTNGKLVLKSTQFETASVADITNNNQSWGNAIVGDVEVQRYQKNKRAWRMLTAPLTTFNSTQNGSLFNNWQNSGIHISGFGTQITGPGGLNGYDAAINQNYSIRSYNTNLGRWEQPVATNAPNSLFGNTPTAANKGYFVFVRGDRSVSASNGTSAKTATTLLAKGTLQQGIQTFNTGIINVGTYYLIGNPYAAAIDFKKVADQSNNIATRFYTWNSALGTNGAYVTCVWNGSQYIQTPQVAISQPTIIQSGEAFWIQPLNTGNVQIVFTENCKASDINTSITADRVSTNEMFAVELLKKDNNSTFALIDGIVKMYNQNYKDTLDFEDAIKFTNMDEGIGISTNNKVCAIEGRPLRIGNDTTYINLANIKQAQYQLNIKPTNLDSSINTFYLFDRYTANQFNLSNNSESAYTFTVNADTNSFAKNRFYIVLQRNALLAASLIDLSATTTNNTSLEWRINVTKEFESFEIERSDDTKNFKPITTLFANSNSVFTYKDVLTEKTVYYRIKGNTFLGYIKYSNIVKVQPKTIKQNFSLTPNFITNKTFNISIQSTAKDNFSLVVIDNLGKILFKKIINVNIGINNTSVNLPSTLGTGIYTVSLMSNNNHSVHNQKVIVQ